MPKRPDTRTNEIRPRLLPSMLLAARRQSHLLQKVVALEAKLDQSYLCALERGRKAVPGAEMLEALCRGLQAEGEMRVELLFAAAHDRVISLLEEEGLAAHAELISVALQAAHHLGSKELAGLTRQIQRAVQSKQQLLALEAEALRGDGAKEEVMT